MKSEKEWGRERERKAERGREREWREEGEGVLLLYYSPVHHYHWKLCSLFD